MRLANFTATICHAKTSWQMGTRPETHVTGATASRVSRCLHDVFLHNVSLMASMLSDRLCRLQTTSISLDQIGSDRAPALSSRISLPFCKTPASFSDRQMRTNTKGSRRDDVPRGPSHGKLSRSVGAAARGAVAVEPHPDGHVAAPERDELDRCLLVSVGADTPASLHLLPVGMGWDAPGGG